MKINKNIIHTKKFESYKRNHKGKYFLDNEEGKIYTQKIDMTKSDKEINDKYNRIVRKNIFDDKSFEEMNLLLKENKYLKSKTHRNRLKELKKNEDFN